MDVTSLPKPARARMYLGMVTRITGNHRMAFREIRDAAFLTPHDKWSLYQSGLEDMFVEAEVRMFRVMAIWAARCETGLSPPGGDPNTPLLERLQKIRLGGVFGGLVGP